VTIDELLHHTGGWDRDQSFDPMFIPVKVARFLHTPPPPSSQAIIGYMLAQSLDFEPGRKSVYTNFGYCLLGRVIEKVSGQSYGEYVEEEVLAPLGIKHMRLGKTLLRDRAPGEVKYYYGGKERRGTAVMGPRLGKEVLWPYGAWCIEAMDSHGGWLASAPDLVRFAAAFEDPAKCKILSKDSINRMFARSKGVVGYDDNGIPKPSFYGCGWTIVLDGGPGQFNYWHNGLLDGASTGLVHRCDGVTWAVLFNSTGFSEDEPYDMVDGRMHEVINQVTKWPAGD